MKKHIAQKLRDSEIIIECENVSSWIKKKARDCYLTIVGSKFQNFELAIFLFRPSRMFMLNNKIELITVLPITKELSIKPRSNGFALKWLDLLETQLEVQTKSEKLYLFILNHLSQASTYQREAFKTGSPTHQWVWYYQASIHPKLKDQSSPKSDLFLYRETVEFKAEHFGQDIMSSYIKEQLKKREIEFITKEDLKVFIGTWNCAGTPPDESVSLTGWLRSGSQNNSLDYRIIVICLQEMCALSAKNIMGDETRATEWEEYMTQQVAIAYPCKTFVKICKQALWGLLTLIYVDQDDIEKVDFLAECSVKLGLKGYMANKGAASLRFEFLNSSFCVINCHLAAHKKKVKARNENVSSVLKQTKFIFRKREIGVYEHDYVIWAGDFNYRIDGLSYDEITNFIERNELRILWGYDQMIRLKESETLLSDFVEGNLEFKPSYKYVKGSSEKREPSWCDRILVRGQMKLLSYNDFTQLFQSDHKPVYAEILFDVIQVNHENKSLVTSEIIENAKKVCNF